MIITILITLTINWGLGYLLSLYKKDKTEREEDIFSFKIGEILNNSSYSDEDKIDRAKKLCRNTEGKLSTGAYLVLDKLTKD